MLLTPESKNSYMSKPIKSLVQINFILSAIVAIGWIGYAKWSGAQIDQHCMGFRFRSSVLSRPAWVPPLLVETIFLGLFFVRQRLNEFGIRVAIGAYSAGCLVFVLVVPVMTQQLHGTNFSSPGRAIWWYACISNVAYALIGSPRSS